MPNDSGELIAPNIYFDRHWNLEAAKILPGEYFVTSRDMVLVTVLGSCVAACVRDRQSGIGGMNHFMLPEGGDAAATGSQAARYGAYAMEVLINHLLKLGAQRRHLEAKVFGGGRVITGFTVSDVGKRNAQFVLGYLSLEGIPIAAQDLLDEYPRKVYFFPATGRVLVKKLRQAHNDTIVQREREYDQRLRTVKVEGDIELFS